MFFNYYIVSTILSLGILHAYNWQLPFSWAEEVPSKWRMFRDVAICMIVEDFWFHITHRMLHYKGKYFPVYQWVHKQHHEHINSVAMTAEDIHWFEYTVSNVGGTVVGPLLMGNRFHYLSMVAWALVRVMQSLDAHCGYDFPWSMFGLLPFGCNATYHHWHHTKNSGNYSSSMTIWDTVFDSNADYYDAHPDGVHNKKNRKLKTG